MLYQKGRKFAVYSWQQPHAEHLILNGPLTPLRARHGQKDFGEDRKGIDLANQVHSSLSDQPGLENSIGLPGSGGQKNTRHQDARRRGRKSS